MSYTSDILNLMSMHFGNYDENSNIGKILRIMSASDEEFLQASEDTKNILDLDQAYGKNLDKIHGINKDLKRGSLTDEEYVQRLKLETKVNNSDGDIPTLTEAAIVLFGDNFQGITETGDAEITTTLDMNGQSIPNETYEKAIAAGVSSFYNMRDESQTIDVVLSDIIFQKYIYIECGTAQCGRTAGSLF